MENEMSDLSDFDKMIGRGLKYTGIGIFLLILVAIIADCTENQEQLRFKTNELISSTMIECAKTNGRWIVADYIQYCVK